MFEIPDDEEFWEDFPFDDAGNLDSMQDVTNTELNNAAHGETDTAVASDNTITNDIKSGDVTVKYSNTKPLQKRKFPGPAGLLPKSSTLISTTGGFPDLEWTKEVSCGNNQDDPQVCSLPSSQPVADSVCNSPLWKRMLEDLGDGAESYVTKFSIKSLLLRASRKLLHKGKAPLVFGLLETVDMQGPDASFVIRDDTGKMKGSLHQDLIVDPRTSLQAGCVVILRQVSVISPSSRTHYLNITPGNIVCDYTPAPPSDSDVSVVKRLWPSDATTPPGSIKSAISSPPSLNDIITQAECELSDSLNNFHKRKMSTNLSRVNGHVHPPHIHPPIASPLYQSGLQPTRLDSINIANTRHALPSKLYTNGISFPRPSSPFVGYTRIPRVTNNTNNECPLPDKLPESVRLQPPSQAANTPYIIRGETISRSNQHRTQDCSNVNQMFNYSPSPHTSSSATENRSKGLQLKENTSDFDFPDDDTDVELLSVCDGLVDDDAENCLNHHNSNINNEPNSNSVMSKLLQECINANRTEQSHCVSSLNQQATSTSKFQLTNNLPSELSGKSFKFKRNLITSPTTPCGTLSNALSTTKRKYIESPASSTDENLYDAESISWKPEVSRIPRGPTHRTSEGTPSEPSHNLPQQACYNKTPFGTVFPQTTSLSNQVNHMPTWNDDLSDELLSQLSEEF